MCNLSDGIEARGEARGEAKQIIVMSLKYKASLSDIKEELRKSLNLSEAEIISYLEMYAPSLLTGKSAGKLNSF